MMSVGKIQSGKPPMRSESAEPKQAAISVSRRPQKSTMRKMAASPRCAYPSGIGMRGTKVARKTTAAMTAARQSSRVVNEEDGCTDDAMMISFFRLVFQSGLVSYC